MEAKRPNKEYKIYKFDCIVRKNDDSHNIHRQRHARASEATKFKIKLIDEMNIEKFDDLTKYTLFAKPLNIPKETYMCTRYGTPGYEMWDQYEIGLDQLHTKYGLKCEYHWSYTYYKVPRKHVELVEWFDKNIPEWVTTVSKI